MNEESWPATAGSAAAAEAGAAVAEAELAAQAMVVTLAAARLIHEVPHDGLTGLPNDFSSTG